MLKKENQDCGFGLTQMLSWFVILLGRRTIEPRIPSNEFQINSFSSQRDFSLNLTG
jgi:hypothetical protein